MEDRIKALASIIKEECGMVIATQRDAQKEDGNIISRIRDFMHCANNGKLLAEHVLTLLNLIEEGDTTAAAGGKKEEQVESALYIIMMHYQRGPESVEDYLALTLPRKKYKPEMFNLIADELALLHGYALGHCTSVEEEQ